MPNMFIGFTARATTARARKAYVLPAPHYPATSADEGEEGTVRIAVHISQEGKIDSATVLSDSQMENRPIRLERAARKAALQGIYLPTIRDGKTVDTTFPISFKFTFE